MAVFLFASFLIAQQACLVSVDRPLMGYRVISILYPVFEQFQVVANTTAVNSDPVDAFDPESLSPVFLERGSAEVETLGRLPLSNKEEHNVKLLGDSVLEHG